jgi:glycosyltransferase involved in cell wall biosynthesis
MKLLWVAPLFLHPTTKGGQIRTLETLRQLSRRHEVHYVGLADPAEPEGPRRSSEYSARAYPVQHIAPKKNSPAFALQLVSGWFSRIPLAVARYRSRDAAKLVASLVAKENFDHIVCDFLAAAPNVPCLDQAVLFQHNVETTIWERRVENASGPLERAYFRRQASRMFEYERLVCQTARRVIAVSAKDAQRMRTMFGVDRVCDVPTGVDLEYFAPQWDREQAKGLVFVGSMDWAPNMDGVAYFLEEVLPLIRKRQPDCPIVIVGRQPPAALAELASRVGGVRITGTVDDVRPYLWSAVASIVPLRIGGGTRLKIFESMAARVPVISTSIGAEGLPVISGEHILIGDDPASFAAHCVEMLENRALRDAVAENGWDLVHSRFSWDQVSRVFEAALQ